MKKIILFVVLFFALGFSFSPLTLAQEETGLPLEDVLGAIKDEQRAEKISDIDCKKLTDEQLEELGDAVMSVMHPQEREHELMDEMMGGEGSDSLTAMHILMGESYLGCSNSQIGYGMGGMMGGGMMGGGGMMSMMGLGNWSNYPWQNNNMMNNMMGNFGSWSFFGWIFMLLFWILLILAIAVIIKWLLIQARGEAKGKSALDILKERYARGEISKEDFEQKKKDLV